MDFEGISLIGINLYRELPYIITGLVSLSFCWVYWHGCMAGFATKRDRFLDLLYFPTSAIPGLDYLELWNAISARTELEAVCRCGQFFTLAACHHDYYWRGISGRKKMKQKYGDDYESFRQRAPFLFPLPNFVRKFFSLPLRLVFKTKYPDRKREIATVVTFYTALLILLSAFSKGMIQLSKKEALSESKIERLVHKIKTSPHRREIRNAASTLAEMGGTAVDSLISLLDSDNVFVRWYCTDALGNFHSEKTVQPLASLLNDPDPNVRRSAAGSLGGTGSDSAIPFLIDAFLDSSKGVESSAARSMGRLKSEAALPVLIRGLKSDHSAIVRSSAWALGEIGSSQAIEPLIACLERKVDWHYFMVGDALRKLGSDKAVDAYIAGMENGAWWMQSSCADALGELKDDKGLGPLIQAVRNGEVRLRRAAVLALSKYSASHVEAVLKEALEDEDWEVRLYAQAALKNIREKNK